MLLAQKLWTIVPAAGVGSRMGKSIPKQYLELAGLTILERSIQRLFSCAAINHIFVILHADDHYGLSLLAQFKERVTIIAGGAQRADSVFQGLLAIQADAAFDDWVLIHDAARPCLRPTDVNLLLTALQDHQVGGLLGEPVTDTLKQIRTDRTIQVTVSRESLWRAFTPQVFKFGLLFPAMEQALQQGLAITDEASAMEIGGYSPLMVEGHSDNIKITRPHDLALASLYLQHQQSELVK
jgi:2-C-methyl-D-erythritol 4-phosphate cytidylyltransferase